MKRSYLVITPQPRPLRIELAGTSDVLAKALLARVKDRTTPSLESHLDVEFLSGVAAVFGLRYGADVLKLVQDCRLARVEVIEEPEVVA